MYGVASSISWRNVFVCPVLHVSSRTSITARPQRWECSALITVRSSCSIWTWGRTSSLWGWQSTGTGCPGRLWSLLLWRYSRPAWTRSCAACCRWRCFGRRVGPDNPQRSLPTPNILWFCKVLFSFCTTTSVLLWNQMTAIFPLAAKDRVP